MSGKINLVGVLLLVALGGGAFSRFGAAHQLAEPAVPAAAATSLWLLGEAKNEGPSPSGPGHKLLTIDAAGTEDSVRKATGARRGHLYVKNHHN